MDTLSANDELFVKALRDVVAEVGPDYTYPDEWRHTTSFAGCSYVVGGRPACLIGRALARLGVRLGALENVEGSSASEVLTELYPVSASVRAAAYIAQDLQDAGFTWGEALALFEEWIAAGRLRPPPPGEPVGG